VPATLEDEVVQELDVTALLAGTLDATSAGLDYVALSIAFPASPGRDFGTVLGLRFVYDPVRITNADIAAGAVTAETLADNAVDSTKVQNNSLTSADVQNGSLTGADVADGTLLSADLGDGSVTSAAIRNGEVRSADILDGTVGAADIDADEVQRRVTGTCSPGHRLRQVLENGGVVCEADRGGLVGYERFTVASTCAGDTACLRTRSCPDGKKLMGGGVHIDETFDFEVFDKIDLVESFPEDENSWTASVVNQNSFTVAIEIHLTCSEEASASSSALAARARRTAAPRAVDLDRPLGRKGRR
jgi:hypothetical protein